MSCLFHVWCVLAACVCVIAEMSKRITINLMFILILRVDVIILLMMYAGGRMVLAASGVWFIARIFFSMLLIGLSLFMYCLVPSRDSWNLLSASSFCFSDLPRVLVVVVNMIALCSVSGRNFDKHFLASFVRSDVGPLAWVMIVVLTVGLLFFVRFDHLVIGFGDHFWVLLRDTVFFVNVILYLIAHFIFLMLFVMLDLILLSGCMVLRFMHVHMRLIMVMRVSVIAKISFERAFVTCWWRWLDV